MPDQALTPIIPEPKQQFLRPCLGKELMQVAPQSSKARCQGFGFSVSGSALVI